MIGLLWLIPLLPFAGFVVNGMLGGRYLSRRTVAVIGCGAVLLSFLISLGAIASLGSLPASNGAPLSAILATNQKGGPYLDMAKERLDGIGHFVDHWGNRYIYTYPGVRNPRLFDLQSYGADRRDDGSGGDDIRNHRFRLFHHPAKTRAVELEGQRRIGLAVVVFYQQVVGRVIDKTEVNQRRIDRGVHSRSLTIVIVTPIFLLEILL